MCIRDRCYIEVKEGIAKNQGEEDTCVLNYDDAVLREFGQDLTVSYTHLDVYKRQAFSWAH